MVERVGWDAEEEERKNGDELLPIIRSMNEKQPLISEHPHRLSIVSEEESEEHPLMLHHYRSWRHGCTLIVEKL